MPQPLISALLLLGLATQLANASAPISTVGILKRASASSGCRTAWFMGTEAGAAQRFCLNLSAASSEVQERVAKLYDEEVAIEGHYSGGAVSLTRLSTVLAPHNGDRPALDYHLDTVTTTRSHDVSARLLENPTDRIRIQPPTTPAQFELVFLGVPIEANVDGLLEQLEILSGKTPLTPIVRRLGGSLILELPSVTPGQLLRIQPTSGRDLTTLLTDTLCGGDPKALSMTLLLSPARYDTP